MASLLEPFSETFTEFIRKFVMTKFNEHMIGGLEDTINSIIETKHEGTI